MRLSVSTGVSILEPPIATSPWRSSGGASASLVWWKNAPGDVESGGRWQRSCVWQGKLSGQRVATVWRTTWVKVEGKWREVNEERHRR